MVLKWAAFISFLLLLFITSCSSGDGTSVDGKTIYQNRCSSCHGPQGDKGVAGAKDLSKSTLSLKERKKIIRNGRGSMIPFKHSLSAEEIQAVAEYTKTLKEAK